MSKYKESSREGGKVGYFCTCLSDFDTTKHFTSTYDNNTCMYCGYSLVKEIITKYRLDNCIECEKRLGEEEINRRKRKEIFKKVRNLDEI